MPSSLIIGRFQPFHAGHAAIVQSVLDEGRVAVVAIRDTELSDSDPYSLRQRRTMIAKVFGWEIERGMVRVIDIPDIDEVVHGRTPGWTVRQVRLSSSMETISGTKIRARLANRTKRRRKNHVSQRDKKA